MNRLPRLLLMLWVALLSAGIPGLAQSPAKITAASVPLAKIPFELFHNRIYLPVSINGQSLSMVVDSGAAVSGLGTQTAQSLQLKISGHADLAGNGVATVPVKLAKDVSIKIGPVAVVEKTVVIVPYQDLERSEGRAIDGVLSVALFRQYVVVVDYAAKILSLYEPENFVYSGSGEVVPLQFAKNAAIFDATIVAPNGKQIPARLAIDSGTYSALRLYAPFVAQYRLRPPAAVASFGFGIGGEFPEALGRVNALQIGSLHLDQPVTSFSEAGHGVTASKDYDGTIGGDILRRFTVTFDYGRHQMILDPNASFSAPFAADRSGLILQASGPALQSISVRHVAASSPSAAAGIREGDIVLVINGSDVRNLGTEGMRKMLCETGTFRLRLLRDQQNVDVILDLGKPLY